MRDGVKLARQGMPVVSLVTEEFWEQGNFVARSLGMPDLPRVKLPHPIAGMGEAYREEVAAAVVASIMQRLAQ
ncbi:MAG: hypothetical protein GWP70_08025 [Proteobacteria bacterium]|nr:hypothetical protein [Pseudomonadota bacterium]